MAKKVTFLSGAQTTGTTTGTGFGVPFPHRWGVFVLKVTTAAAGGTLDVKFQYYDPASTVWTDLKGSDQSKSMAFAQTAAAGTSFLIVDKAVLTETTNKAIKQVLPSTLRAVGTVGAVSDPANSVSQQGS